ncbi:MAG: NUDIX hydrolase [Acidimicrobiia bacterium]|nr:NUDIX hydrolase [Acidimicrobiia bacterium]
MRIDVIDHAETAKPALPAATVLLLRDGSEGVEVLMIHRHSKTAFGGMWAFPGGVVEDADIPAGTEPDPLPAARRAAARETREEVGLVVAETDLVFHSHWLPPADAPVRFSTWFFAGLTPGGAVEMQAGEVHDHAWLSAREALQRQRRREIELVTPTFVTLDNLARAERAEEVLAVAEPEFFATRSVRRADGVRLCLYHGDAGYESGDAEAAGARRRLTLDNRAGWVWEDTRRG